MDASNLTKMTKSHNIMHKTFFQMEEENKLFDAKCYGFSPWRVMRNYVFNRYLNLGLSQSRLPTIYRIFLALQSTILLAWILLRGRKVDLLVKTCATALRSQKSGKWHDIVFDPLLENGYSHLKIMEINSSSFQSRVKYAAFPAHFEPTAVTFWGKILGKFFPADLSGFESSVVEAVKKYLSIDVDAATLNALASTAIWQSKIYGLLLARTRPGLVIVSDTAEFGLRLACLRAEIPFAEIQHGVFDPLHPDAIPESAPGTDEELLVPDFFLTKGQYWIDRLAGFRNARVAIPVGSSSIDELRHQLKTPRETRPFTLVLSSQGQSESQLISWIKAILVSAPFEKPMTFHIKLHPLYDPVDNFTLPLAEYKQVQVHSGASEPNIYSLLSSADLHLSVSSACIFDAASMGVPSLVIPVGGHEIILDAIDNRAIFLAETPDDVWSINWAELDNFQQEFYSHPDNIGSLNAFVKPFLKSGKPN
jgi:hypothetical protein